MRCPPCLALVLLLALPAAAPGQEEAVRACEVRLQALREAEDQAVAQGRTRDRATAARLAALRREAARLCLGASGEAGPPPQSVARPPSTVMPSVPPPAAVAVPEPSVPPPVRVAPAAPPPTVTACQDAGCWSSDGRFLPRTGPVLSGPRGACTVGPGGVLHCP